MPHCPQCGKEIKQQSVDQIVDQVIKLPHRTKIQVLSPIVRGRKGEYSKVFETARKNGYVRVRVDGEIMELSDEIKLDKNKKHNIELIIDRLIIKEGITKRLTDSIETALEQSEGLVIIDIDGGEMIFSQNYACYDCGISIEEMTPRMFSFNSPFGACSGCAGLGYQMKIDPDLVIPTK